MRTIIYLVQKEFIQIFRNRTLLPIIFVAPLVQLIVLLYAATLDMKGIDMFIVDQDLSLSSRRLTQKFISSPFYRVNDFSFSIDQAEHGLKSGAADVVLVIPAGFERDFLRETAPEVQLLIDAINGTAAGLINAYTTAIINGYNLEVIPEVIQVPTGQRVNQLDVSYSLWYNPHLNYKIFMLPALMVILVTIIGMFLSALNMVREKELGTIEQINVTPIRKYHFIIGKLLPFWILALVELGVLLFVGKIFFSLPTLGSIALLYLFASVYLLVVMGASLFISNVSQSQQQVMFLIFFFMIVFIMMSGIFTPVETMPYWAQKINIINPLAYFVRVVRMILLKGSTFMDTLPEFRSLAIYAAIIFTLAVWRYRKTM